MAIVESFFYFLINSPKVSLVNFFKFLEIFSISQFYPLISNNFLIGSYENILLISLAGFSPRIV
jgi:hypothetical protein